MIYTNLVPLPFSVKEFVHETVNGDHIVFINENLCSEEQKEAYDHAVEHINNSDFCSDQTADDIELLRH